MIVPSRVASEGLHACKLIEMGRAAAVASSLAELTHAEPVKQHLSLIHISEPTRPY